MTLDKNNLQKLYAYILTLTKRKETVEVTLLEEMLEGKSFEILTKVEQRQVLKVLKQNPNIGLRQLARITGVSLGIIHRL